MVKLFDLENGVVIPSIHCYTLKFLKNIMDEYPEDYLKIYLYLFYMTCPNPDMNPFFHTTELEKEDIILDEIDAEFSVEDESIIHGLDMCRKLYETETSRAYRGIKMALDNMADYMAKTPITDGRDGNISQMTAVAKNFDPIRQSFKGVYKDLQEEQSSSVRGGQDLAYDAI